MSLEMDKKISVTTSPIMVLIPPKDKISFLFDIFQADECKSNNLCVGRFFYNTNTTLTLFYFYTQITLYSYLIYLSAP